MNERDYNYIEGRLYPGANVVEAIIRLRALGEVELATAVMAAERAYADKLRQLRLELHSYMIAGREG